MTEVMGEVVEEHETYLPAVREQSPTLFGTTNPAEVIERATEAAQPLAAVVRKQKLTTTISGREHVRVEGWTLLGSMLGVFPVTVWTRKMEDGWEARVEARTRDGSIVGAAEAECLRSESLWKSRDDYALRSMAQTRATSKALRQPLGFVMQLAGFEATPAEEMPHEEQQVDLSNPASVEIGFGKHKGKSLGQIHAEDSSYLKWLAENAKDARIAEAARAVMSGTLPIIEEQEPVYDEDIPF